MPWYKPVRPLAIKSGETNRLFGDGNAVRVDGTCNNVINAWLSCLWPASSANLNPQEVTWRAKRQSPLWGDTADKNLAIWYGSEMEDYSRLTIQNARFIPEWLLVQQRIRRWQGTMFWLPHWQIWIKNVSVVLDEVDKICDWRSKLLAAEAKNAGSVSERTRLIPRSPSLISKLACNHCISVMCVLEIRLRANLKWLSNIAALSTEGEQHKRCWTRGTLNESRSSSNVSWAFSRESLSTASFRYLQPADHESSKTLTWKSGAREVSRWPHWLHWMTTGFGQWSAGEDGKWLRSC